MPRWYRNVPCAGSYVTWKGDTALVFLEGESEPYSFDTEPGHVFRVTEVGERVTMVSTNKDDPQTVPWVVPFTEIKVVPAPK